MLFWKVVLAAPSKLSRMAVLMSSMYIAVCLIAAYFASTWVLMSFRTC